MTIIDDATYINRSIKSQKYSCSLWTTLPNSVYFKGKKKKISSLLDPSIYDIDLMRVFEL